MNKKFSATLFLLGWFFVGFLQAQSCMLYPVSLSQRIHNASIVVEGKVVDKTSYWNDAHTQILTAYFIEVYKVFKGNQVPDTVAFVTQGGQVGLEILKVEPGIEFNPGDYGVFTLDELSTDFVNIGITASWNHVDFYRDYGWSQAFISINEGIVHDIFYNYKDNLLQNLYETMFDIMGISSYTELKQTPDEYLMPSPGELKAITGFSPANVTAGTLGPAGVLTINGVGFGAVRGTGLVRFRNADDGGATFVNVGTDLLTDFISWSDVQVVVRVPSGAGTGTFQLITNGGGSTFTSGTAVVVDYNALDIIFDPGTGFQRYEPDLVNDNGVAVGDYTLTFNTGFFGNAPAVASFRDALANWVFRTGVNFVDAGAATSAIAANAGGDGVNIVTFNAALGVGVLGVSFSSWNGCFSGGGLHWFLLDVDLLFDPTPGAGTWYFGCPEVGIAGAQFDFESVAVHELGHHHQLGHIINAAGVMHFSIANGQVKRLIAPNDEAGGDYEMVHSMIANPCGPAAMTFLAGPPPVCAPLPVELVSFDAVVNEREEVELSWTTASEINNDYFKIQRSTNLIDFFDIAEVNGAGNSSVPLNYTFTDMEPFDGISYYRLHQVDFNGQFSNTAYKAVSIGHDDVPLLSIIPNPAHDFITLQFSDHHSHEVKIYDGSGKLLLIRNANPGDLIDIEDLANGFYFIQAMTAHGKINTGKFLISH